MHTKFVVEQADFHRFLTFGFIHQFCKEDIPNDIISLCCDYNAPSSIPIVLSYNAQRGGQKAINVLDPKAGAGWNGGDYVKHKYNGPNWIIFRFEEAVQVIRFAYRTQGDRTHDPKDMTLHTNGKEVLKFEGKSMTKEWQIFDLPIDNIAIGQDWRWNIWTRHSYWQAYVVAVQFQIKVNGKLIPNDFQASLAMDVKRKGNC